MLFPDPPEWDIMVRNMIRSMFAEEAAAAAGKGGEPPPKVDVMRDPKRNDEEKVYCCFYECYDFATRTSFTRSITEKGRCRSAFGDGTIACVRKALTPGPCPGEN